MTVPIGEAAPLFLSETELEVSTLVTGLESAVEADSSNRLKDSGNDPDRKRYRCPEAGREDDPFSLWVHLMSSGVSGGLAGKFRLPHGRGPLDGSSC